jgi:hypothetical protein
MFDAGSSLSAAIQAAARRHAEAGPAAIQRLKLRLAALVAPQAPANAVNHLALAQRFVDGAASSGELLDARQDVWAYVGSLACYCSPTDSASAQAILACLESSPAAHASASLPEQVERVLCCGVSEAQVLSVLR